MFLKKQKIAENTQKGIDVSIDELIEQKRYLPYIKRRHNNIVSDQVGDIKSAFKGRGMEFEEVRAYEFGDDVRDIDWRVTARKNETYTKVFAEEKDREVYVILDLSPYMLFGTKKELKSVSAAKLAALLGWQSLINKDRFGLILYTGEETKLFKSQSSQKNFMAILKTISITTKDIVEKSKNKLSERKIGLEKSIQLAQYIIKSHAMVFILSDFKNISDMQPIVALTKRNRVYCVNIYDVVEEIAPISGEYMAEYNGERLVFDTSSEIFKRTYYYHFLDKRRSIENFCKRFGCYYLNIRTDRPLHKQLKIL